MCNKIPPVARRVSGKLNPEAVRARYGRNNNE
jgi:hypothetical protein